MAEAMEVDSDITKHANCDNMSSMKSDTAALQEKATAHDALVEVKSPFVQEPIETISPSDSKEPPQVFPEKVCESEPHEKNAPNQESSIETFMDKPDAKKENLLNKELNTHIPSGQPDKNSGSQELTKVSEPVTKCMEKTEYLNKEDLTKCSQQQMLDMSLSSDCELIADTVFTVDLTMDDSITQAIPLGQKIIQFQNLTNQTLTEKVVADKSFTESQISSFNIESGNAQIENQSNSIVLTTDEFLAQDIAQSNSGVEANEINEEELQKNVTYKDAQEDSSQNDSTLSLHTIADQDKTDTSMENSIINETPIEQNNLKDVAEKIHQNIEEDVTMKECNTKESSNKSPYKVNEEENEISKDSQIDSVQNDLTLSLQTIADQGRTDTTPIEKNNLKIMPENINQNFEEDVALKECNTNEPSNKQASIHKVIEEENEASKGSQVDSSQIDSTLCVHSIANQNKANINMEDTKVNKTTAEQNNSKVSSEKINQHIEEDIATKVSNKNESLNKQGVSTSEPKQSQINSSTDKSVLIGPATQTNTAIKVKRSQCPICFKFHLEEVCWHAKGPRKRNSKPLIETPSVKKQKTDSRYPADIVSLIARHTPCPPEMSDWTKLKLIKGCQILYLNHIPKSWTRFEMKDFIENNVECINEALEICYFFFILDPKFNSTGECLIKFKNSDYCQKAWYDLRDVKIENTPVSVDLDLGHNIMRQVRKDSKMRGKLLNEELTNNVDKSVKQQHPEVSPQNNQGNEHFGANNSAANAGGAGTSNTSQNYEQHKNIYIKPKLFYMPPEKLDNTTYGLNEEFLKSLDVKVPLCSVIVVMWLELDLSDEKIKEVFSLAGTVKRAFRVLKKDGSPTMKGIVEYDHPVEAVQAVSMFHDKILNGRSLTVKMAPRAFPRPLPEGLTGVGPGLGFEGEPMRGVRALIELQSLKKTLMDFKNTFDNKIAEMEKSIASLNKSVAALNAKKPPEPEQPKIPPTPPPQTQPQTSEVAAQLANAINSLTQPNVLMGLTTLLSAQGLVQQGMGADQAAMANAMQNQMMMQNATYAQNVNMQGMAQSMLPGAFPQPGLAQTGLTQLGFAQPGITQPGLAQPGLTQPGLPQPGLAQPMAMDQAQMFYGQPQMIQSYMAMPTAPSPAPVAPSSQVKPQPPTSYPKTTAPAASKQQMPAYTPKVLENKESKSKPTTSNWNMTPVTAPMSQKPQPAYSSEPMNYKRPSRFDMKEKPNLKVIEPEPEKKNDLLVFSNLPPSVNVQALNSKMREVGDVIFGEMTGRGRALVRFKHVRDAERCIKLFNRSKVDGQVITVEYF